MEVLTYVGVVHMLSRPLDARVDQSINQFCPNVSWVVLVDSFSVFDLIGWIATAITKRPTVTAGVNNAPGESNGPSQGDAKQRSQGAESIICGSRMILIIWKKSNSTLQDVPSRSSKASERYGTHINVDKTKMMV